MSDYIFKSILVGDTNVGKTSLMNKFISSELNKIHDITIGVDLESKLLNINSKIIKLQIWDTTGQERFRSIISSYFRNCAIAFIVFDVGNNKSFHNAYTYWFETLKKKCHKNTQIIIVGNKCDSFERVVSKEEAQKKAKEIKVNYVETSCKNNFNIDIMFIDAVKQLLEILPKIKKEEYGSMGVKSKNENQGREIRIEKSHIACCITM